MIELLKSLGADGIHAFYVYLAVDTLQLFVVVGLFVWGVRGAMVFYKNNVF